jgi:hypothetical protein
MRRAPWVVSSAVVLVLAAAGPAVAKQTSLTLVAPSGSPHAGRVWTPSVRVKLDGRPYPRAAGYRPRLSIFRPMWGPTVATFTGRRTGRPGEYRIRMVFPRPGVWRYAIPDPLTGDWYFRIRVGR